MFYDFYNRTDNTYLPNSKQGWVDFHWQLHMLGGKAIIAAWFIAAWEIEHRSVNSSNKYLPA